MAEKRFRIGKKPIKPTRRKENKAQIEAELVRRAKKKVVDAKKSIERLEKKLAIAKSRLEAQ